MQEIRKFIRKRVNYNERFDRGFMYYCLKISGKSVVITEISNVVSEIKKDFPNTKDEQIAIKSLTADEVILFFYTFEIPIELKIDEFNY